MNSPTDMNLRSALQASIDMQDNDPAYVLTELAVAIDKVSDLVLTQPCPDEDAMPIYEQATRLNNILAAAMMKQEPA